MVTSHPGDNFEDCASNAQHMPDVPASPLDTIALPSLDLCDECSNEPGRSVITRYDQQIGGFTTMIFQDVQLPDLDQTPPGPDFAAYDRLKYAQLVQQIESAGGLLNTPREAKPSVSQRLGFFLLSALPGNVRSEIEGTPSIAKRFGKISGSLSDHTSNVLNIIDTRTLDLFRDISSDWNHYYDTIDPDWPFGQWLHAVAKMSSILVAELVCTVNDIGIETRLEARAVCRDIVFQILDTPLAIASRLEHDSGLINIDRAIVNIQRKATRRLTDAFDELAVTNASTVDAPDIIRTGKQVICAARNIFIGNQAGTKRNRNT